MMKRVMAIVILSLYLHIIDHLFLINTTIRDLVWTCHICVILNKVEFEMAELISKFLFSYFVHEFNVCKSRYTRKGGD